MKTIVEDQSLINIVNCIKYLVFKPFQAFSKQAEPFFSNVVALFTYNYQNQNIFICSKKGNVDAHGFHFILLVLGLLVGDVLFTDTVCNTGIVMQFLFLKHFCFTFKRVYFIIKAKENTIKKQSKKFQNVVF